MDEIALDVAGMHCSSCAKTINENLLKKEGVEKAEADFAEEKARISFDSAKISEGEIKTEIENLGYTIKKNSFLESQNSDNAKALAKEKTAWKQGIAYGLVPHIGCIGFAAASILGVTVAVEFFKPLLMNPWFFYILIGISILFATASTMFYLRKNGILSMKGAARKKKYIGTMYASTIGINLLFFLFIFPLAANFGNVSAASPTGAVTLPAAGNSISTMTLQVQIPCSGHAPLITGELKKISGVTGVQFSMPNNFAVSFDSAKTTKEQILAIDVFKQYSATVTTESNNSGSKANLESSTGVAPVTAKIVSSGGTCRVSGGSCCGSSGTCGCGAK